MTAIKIQSFGGKVPKVSDRLLPDNMAQTASNTKLYSGELRGWRTPKQVYQFNFGSPVISAYRFELDVGGGVIEDVWMGFIVDTDVVPAPLVNDSYQRYYWTQAGQLPQVSSALCIWNTGKTPPVPSCDGTGNYQSYNLGVIPPPDTPVLSDLADGTAAGQVEDRIYAYTFVTNFGEEGPPTLSNAHTAKTDDTWVLSGMTDPAALTGDDANRNIEYRRVYRTVSGFGSTAFFRVDHIGQADGYPGIPTSPTTTTFNDTSTNVEAALSEQLQSTSWQPPPDGLHGLIVHPNGFLLGFLGRDLYMSEPYRPHAWPAEYVLTVDYPIVGLGQIDTSIVIATESHPYAASGVNPSSMTLVKSTDPEPCLSKRSVVNMLDKVVYASNKGLIVTNGVLTDSITKDVMSISDWQTLYASESLFASSYGDRYFGFYAESAAFFFDPREPQRSLVDISLPTVDEVYVDELSGDTYVIQNQNVSKWDATGTRPLSYTWKSKEFTLPRPVNFGAAQVKFDVPSDFGEVDPDLILTIEQRNSDVITAAQPPNPNGLATINSRPIGGSAHVPWPTDDIPAAEDPIPQAKLGAINGSAIIPEDFASGYASNLRFEVLTHHDGEGEVVKFSKTLLNSKPFKLPSGFKHEHWSFRLTGNVDVYSVDVAETSRELNTL